MILLPIHIVSAVLALAFGYVALGSTEDARAGSRAVSGVATAARNQQTMEVHL